MGQSKLCLKQDSNSAIDVPEFGSIDPGGVNAQSENYIKISFLPIFYLQEEKRTINNNNSKTHTLWTSVQHFNQPHI